MSQGQNFLPKFLFVSNLLKAMKIRERVPNDVVKPSASGGPLHHLRGMHRYTLEMIRMSQFPQAFREIIQSAILDRAMQTSLEQEKRLNWCREVKKLVPLRTNGNSLALGHLSACFGLDTVARRHTACLPTTYGMIRFVVQSLLSFPKNYGLFVKENEIHKK